MTKARDEARDFLTKFVVCLCRVVAERDEKAEENERLKEENRDLVSKKNWCNERARNLLDKRERLSKALEGIEQAAEAERSRCGVTFDFAFEIGEMAQAALKEDRQDG